jgi:membrane protein implicated in regulation of membrane protease activity
VRALQEVHELVLDVASVHADVLALLLVDDLELECVVRRHPRNTNRVALTIAVILAILFIPWPWSLVAILGGVLIEIGEVVWGLRLARRWKPKTGAEAMIGKEADVVAACRPLGEVRVHGELWRASCDEGADRGERVRIERIEGLTLVVTRVGA